MTRVPTHRLSPATSATSTDTGDDWRHRAACKDEDGELFFAADGERANARPFRVALAQAVCGACPVQQECLTDALRNNDEWSVRGGIDLSTMSQRSRYRLRANHDNAA